MIIKDSTLPSMFGEWLLNKHQLSNSSLHYYILGIKRFLAENPQLDNLEHYNTFLVKVMIKKRCSNYYSMIKKFIEFKFEGDSQTKNKLIDGLIKPKTFRDIKFARRTLQEDEIIEVINCLKDPKHRLVALIQHLTGVRAGDIMRLKRQHIQPDMYYGKSVLKLSVIGKRKKINTVFIHDEIAQTIIMNYLTQSEATTYKDYVFIGFGKIKNRKGNVDDEFKMEKMNYMWYWFDLKQALQTMSIKKEDFATHDFRRCFARRVWDKYKDIQILQNILNHSNPAVTMLYLRQSGLQNRDYQYEMQTGESYKKLEKEQKTQ